AAVKLAVWLAISKARKALSGGRSRRIVPSLVYDFFRWYALRRRSASPPWQPALPTGLAGSSGMTAGYPIYEFSRIAAGLALLIVTEMVAWAGERSRLRVQPCALLSNGL
ncbi:MAG TPA: hypothetical protein VNT30_14530, partial [Stellaceae bacterium]|nr:hypothetical protein [Stellaceae bacterium]